MSHLFHIADRVLNRPLLIMPEKLAVITEVLAGRIGLDASAVAGLVPEASRFEGEQAFEMVGGGKQALPYRRNADGTAIIAIIGSLVNRGAWVGASSGLVSYEGLSFQIAKAAADPATKAIVLDMQSPGGEAVGAFECAAVVRKVAQEKPVVAVVNGMAASAAYAIASACRSIVSIDTGISGSIGVVMMHADYSRAIDKAGITPTLIHAGAHKVDGNPYQPLPAGVRSELQAEVDAFYEKFLETVAAGRGKRLTAKAARATEARCLIGPDAKAAGLVDEIGTFADVIDSLRRAGAQPASARAAASANPAPVPAAMASLAKPKKLNRASAFAALAGRPLSPPPGRQSAFARMSGIAPAEPAKADAVQPVAPAPSAATPPKKLNRAAVYARSAGNPGPGRPDSRSVFERLGATAVRPAPENTAAVQPAAPAPKNARPGSLDRRAIFARLGQTAPN